MNDEAPSEGTPGLGRVEAFSDGVVAIIVTIMVLDLRPPERPGFGHLLALWPVALAYALSFTYVGLYWANHHRLFSHARRVTNGLIWANMGLLFTLSLMPFASAYLGEQRFSRDATLVYLAVMLSPTIFYPWLQAVIRRTGVQGPAADTYHRRTTRKAVVAIGLYLAGFALTFASPWLGVASALVVAVLWFLPSSRIDSLFDDHRAGQRAAARGSGRA